MGKIELLAVAAAGIYCQFKSVTSVREEDAVPRKNERPQQIETILDSERLVR